MALITSPTETIPDLNYEYHTITVDTIGQESANTFTCFLNQPLKNVVQARLFAARINSNVATEHCYVSIDQLDSIFSDRTSNVYDGQAPLSIIRNSFASIVKSEDLVRVDRLNVTIRNQNGIPIVPSTPAKDNFLVLRFVCRKPNM